MFANFVMGMHWTELPDTSSDQEKVPENVQEVFSGP